MKTLCKRTVAVLMAAALPLSVSPAFSAGAEESDLAPGQYNDHGKYQKSQDKIVTQHLMFAMPLNWQNEITKNPKCNGAAALYWWTGWDNPEDNLPHGWPGYECEKVEEEGVSNLYAIDAPNFGNGEKGNGTMIIWNNNLDGGTETDSAKNPFREAAQQTRDFQAGYYSRNDENEKYEPLFRYIYRYNLEKIGVQGAAGLDLQSETFWEDINKVAAKYLGKDYDKEDPNERGILVDEIMDKNDLDFSVFGEKYASNFFNSDTIEEQYKDLYPEEENGDGCISFHFDNMVFVVNFDPEKMQESPVSHKIGFDGDFYFYYGGGWCGTWPTEELNTEMKGEKIRIIGYGSDPLPTPSTDPTKSQEPTSPTTAPQTTSAAVPFPATDVSSFPDPGKGGNGGSGGANNANGAVATGRQTGFAIVLIALAAGVGAAVFFRKKDD